MIEHPATDTAVQRALDQHPLIDAQPSQVIVYARFKADQTFMVMYNADWKAFARLDRDAETLHLHLARLTDDILNHLQTVARDDAIVHWYVIRQVIEAARHDGVDILALRGTLTRAYQS